MANPEQSALAAALAKKRKPTATEQRMMNDDNARKQKAADREAQHNSQVNERMQSQRSSDKRMLHDFGEAADTPERREERKGLVRDQEEKSKADMAANKSDGKSVAEMYKKKKANTSS
jgi:hypothetical protein